MTKLVNQIITRKKEITQGLIDEILKINSEANVMTKEEPISMNEIHHKTTIGVSKVPVVSLTILISREDIIDSHKTKELKTYLQIDIEDECPEEYRKHLDRYLNPDRYNNRHNN